MVQVQDFFFLHLDRFGTIQLDSDLLVLKSKDLDFLARLWSPVLALVRGQQTGLSGGRSERTTWPGFLQ